MNTFEVRLGVLAPPLKEQVRLPHGEVEKLELIRRSINVLRIHGYLTPSETKKVERRLANEIFLAIEEAEE